MLQRGTLLRRGVSNCLTAAEKNSHGTSRNARYLDIGSEVPSLCGGEWQRGLLRFRPTGIILRL